MDICKYETPHGQQKGETAPEKVAMLWSSLVEFLSAFPDGIRVAIEWPRGCTYWDLPTAKKMLAKLNLVAYSFDGCADVLPLAVLLRHEQKEKQHAAVGRQISPKRRGHLGEQWIYTRAPPIWQSKASLATEIYICF